jgi:16S rRNA (uracil1498-N3)-methyltransferase
LSINNFFYSPDIEGAFHTLDKDDSNHLVRVLRIKQGDKVFVTNGKGLVYECVVTDPNPRGCQLEIIQLKDGDDKRKFNLSIGIAPTKNINRFEWFLEKSTEIGIDTFIPVHTENSERKVIKEERLSRVITAAVKQSLKSFHPELKSMTSFSELIKLPFDGQKFIAYVDSTVKEELHHLCKPVTNTLVLIGPEGDFSTDEISLAREHGFIPVKLGPSRLRTETAGVVACHTINLVNLS